MYNKYGKNVNVILKEQIKNACPVKDIASVPANAKISGESTEIKQVEVFMQVEDEETLSPSQGTTFFIFWFFEK